MKASEICLSILFAFYAADSFCQTFEIPSKPLHTSDEDYRVGVGTLKSAYGQVKLNNFQYVAADYWNFATAYSQMGQPRETVQSFLSLSKQVEKVKFCQIAEKYHSLKGGIENTNFFRLLGNDYKILISDCEPL